MPAFSYEVLDAQGQTRKGMIEADSAKAARNQLRAQAMVPLVVEPTSIDIGGPAFLADLLASIVREFVTIEHEIAQTKRR